LRVSIKYKALHYAVLYFIFIPVTSKYASFDLLPDTPSMLSGCNTKPQTVSSTNVTDKCPALTKRGMTL